MNAEELFLQKYGNKITASESWVIRFAEEYAKLKVDAVLRQPDVIKSVCDSFVVRHKYSSDATCEICGKFPWEH